MSIQTFILVKERCLLAHMNVRTEMHGDERDPAVDLKFEFSSANNLLSKLHQDLRATFYCGDANQDMVTPDNMPHLRFPFMGPVPWELEIPRTRLRIHDADKPENDIVLGGGKTNKFKLVMKNGGTVEWSFRCQFSKPDEDIVAKLMRALNQRVPVSLECAEEEEEGDNFDKVDKLSARGAEPSEARLKAESLFDAPPTNLAITTPNDVVNADFDEDAAPAAPATNVAPITRAKRGGKRASGGGIE
jgi:hypothetical protein